MHRTYRSAFSSAALALLALSGCAHESDGPRPTIEVVTPDVICTAQFDVPVTLTGSGFAPVVEDGLTDDPRVVMPRVFLIAPDGTATEVPAERVALPPEDLGGRTLAIVIPQGLVGPVLAGQSEVVYDVRVANPNRHDDVRDGGLTVVPPPELTQLAPRSGIVDTQVRVALTGTGFRAGMAVRLLATPPVVASDVTVDSGTSASLIFDLTGVAPGTYDVEVRNADGCAHTLPDAFTVIPAPFAITGIDPPFGCTCEPTTVTVTSLGMFASTPRIELVPHDAPTSAPIGLERVAFLDASTLTAVVPAGLAHGTYDVWVRNPDYDARIGFLASGFRVVDEPIPFVTAIVPGRGNTQDPTPVSIYGGNFRAPMRIELIDQSLAVAVTLDGISPTSATRIDATFPTTTMTAGPYLVRVQDLDEATWFTFSGFLVTNPAGNLNPFTSATAMTTARRSLAGVFGLDTLGNQYVYAIGGDAGDGGAVHDTIERSQVSKFGALGSWQEQAERLVVPRTGAAAVMVPVFGDASPFVPVKSYLYVLGGKDDHGAVLDTVERAVLLDVADAPVITSIEAVPGGTLDSGTWYYVVSAVLPESDADNPGGETPASEEAIATTAVDGSLKLTWGAVTVNGAPAAGYRIYRSDAVNGRSTSEHLIAEVTGTSYTDTGADPGTVPPQVSGATGRFVVLPDALPAAVWGLQATLAHDATGARFIVALGGRTSADGGAIATVSRAAIDDQGHSASFVTAGSTAMSSPRAFFALALETQATVSTFGSAGARLWAAGGVDNRMLDTLEGSDLASGGGNGAWNVNGKKVEAAAGAMAIIANDKLFILGGARAEGGGGFSGILATGRDTEFDAQGDISGSINSTANGLTSPRAFGIGLPASGFFYFIGGTSTGDNALATVERTF